MYIKWCLFLKVSIPGGEKKKQSSKKAPKKLQSSTKLQNQKADLHPLQLTCKKTLSSFLQASVPDLCC